MLKHLQHAKNNTTSGKLFILRFKKDSPVAEINIFWRVLGSRFENRFCNKFIFWHHILLCVGGDIALLGRYFYCSTQIWGT